MPGVVCAVRGGPESRRTIARSLDLAQETGLPLYFLYVVNLDFLSQTPTSRVHTISQEMHQMGEFILLMAQQTAARQHISAEARVRHGNVGEELAAFCHEVDADYLVLGRPKVEREDAVFSQEKLERFVERIEGQTGATVVLPQEESR